MFSKIAAAFSSKYASKDSDWDGHSGAGSDPRWTLAYRGLLETFVEMNGVRSIVDVGCGDWQFSRFLNLDGVDYLGLDVVDAVVARNTARFARPGVRFELMPAELSRVPSADLLIVKDVLQHLPNADILRFRDELFPRYASCLVTNSYEKMHAELNTDVAPGEFRCLDLRAPPYEVKGRYVLEFFTPLWERVRTLLI